MAQKFLTDIEVTRGLVDSSGDLGVAGQVLSSTGSGTNWITNEANSTVVYLDEFTGDNSTVGFTLSVSVTDENITQVYIDGVYQNKDTYSVSGTTLTFSTAPPLNADIEVITFSTATTSDDLAAGSVVIPVKNTHTASIAKGEPVYITGNVGASARLQIAPADASNSAKMPSAGLLLQTLAVNAEGYVITGGYLRNLTTDTIDGTSTSSNDTVYVKPGGGLTMTKPTGSNLIQNVAKVASSSGGNSGSLLVSSILRTNDIPNLTTGKIWVGDGNTVESTVVHLDESNQRLGIGTSSPATTLHVDGGDLRVRDSGNVALQIISSDSNNSAIQFGDDGDTNDGRIVYENTGDNMKFYTLDAEKMRIDSSGNVNIYGTDNRPLAITSFNTVSAGAGWDLDATSSNGVITMSTGGTERMRITSGGNVGIGNTNPNAGLQIALGGTSIPSAGSNTGSVCFGNTTSGSAYGLVMGANSSGVGYISSQRTDGGATIYNLAIQPNGGNVGIGTSSPNTILEIASGNSGGNAALDAPVFRINNTTESSDWDVGDVVGSIEYYTSDESGNAPYVTSFIKSVNETGNGTLPDGALSFGTATYNASGGAAERMRIDSNGNIGINATLENSSGTWRNFNFGSLAMAGRSNNTIPDAIFGTNFKFTTANAEQRISAHGASRLFFNDDEINFQNAGPDSAGSNIGWNTRLTIDSSGNTTFAGTINSDNITVGKTDGNNSSISLTANTGNWTFTNVQASRNLEISDSDGTGTVMTIDTSGRVGIGTTSPSKPLHIQTNDSAYGSMRIYRDSTTQGEVSIGFFAKSNQPTNQAWVIGEGGWIGGGKFVIGNENGGAGGNVRLVIEKAGNVGIGTSSPTAKLNTFESDNLYDPQILVQTDTTSVVSYMGIATNKLKFYRNVSTGVNFEIQTSVASGSSGGHIVFMPNAGNHTPTERMRITSGGNVNISTSGAQLFFANNGEIRCFDAFHRIRFRRSEDILEFVEYGDIIFTTGSTATERMRIDSSGATSFAGSASVSTAVASIQHLSSNGYLYIKGGSGGLIIGDDSTSSRIQIEDNSNIRFETAGTERMRIDSSGRVGIGTTSPDYRLTVAKTSIAAPAFMVSGAYYGGPRIQTYGLDADPNAWMGLGTDMSGAAYEHSIYFSDTGSLGRLSVGTYNGTTYSEKMCVLRTGNVGIGTTSPVTKLHVVDTTTLVGAFASNNSTRTELAIDNTSTNNVRLGLKATPSGAIIDSTNHSGSNIQPLIFQVNASEKIRITSGGEVLINKQSARGSEYLGIESSGNEFCNFQKTNGARAFRVNCTDSEGFNTSGTTIFVGKNGTTNRSINAGGTINASGADYAEYMNKAIEEDISKGDIVGVNSNGELTNIFNDSISFVVKSTNPSYVGGDTWGVNLEGDALEEARLKVDRIAFSGQVPCNVYEASVGDYIIPINNNGKISAQAISNPTFDEYKLSVGKVWKIMEDGRAWIAVKIA